MALKCMLCKAREATIHFPGNQGREDFCLECAEVYFSVTTKPVDKRYIPKSDTRRENGSR